MTSSNWKWVAASERGSAHEALGERRQDAVRVLTAGSFLIMCACDGAGSAAYGGAGAALTARMMSRFAQESIIYAGRQPDMEEVVDWIQALRLAISTAAERRGCETSAFATTLVLAISDGSTTQVLHVGDGAAVARRVGDDAFHVLSWPHGGEYASETFFITDSDVQLHAYMTRRPIDRLAVMTDGMERLALDFCNKAAHSRFFEAVFAPVTADIAPGHDVGLSTKLRQFLASPSVVARTDDDKTLILAARA